MKTILVSGTSSGIGHEICIQALKLKYRVISISRNTKPLENIKGIEPKIAMDIHAKVENRKVCFRLSLYSFCKFVSTNKTPTNIVIKDEAKKL